MWRAARPPAGAARPTAAPRPCPGARAAHAQGAAEPLWTGNDHVFGLLRSQAGERLLLLANFTPERQPVGLALLNERGLEITQDAAQPDGRPLVLEQDTLVLEPYQYVWLRD